MVFRSFLKHGVLVISRWLEIFIIVVRNCVFLPPDTNDKKHHSGQGTKRLENITSWKDRSKSCHADSCPVAIKNEVPQSCLFAHSCPAAIKKAFVCASMPLERDGGSQMRQPGGHSKHGLWPHMQPGGHSKHGLWPHMHTSHGLRNCPKPCLHDVWKSIENMNDQNMMFSWCLISQRKLERPEHHVNIMLTSWKHHENIMNTSFQKMVKHGPTNFNMVKPWWKHGLDNGVRLHTSYLGHSSVGDQAARWHAASCHWQDGRRRWRSWSTGVWQRCCMGSCWYPIAVLLHLPNSNTC